LKPVDYRNATWMELRSRLQGAREQVYGELQKHGPCSTRELAYRSGIDVCSVRPRITELLELGLAECDGAEGGEGRYRAVSLQAAEEAFARRCELGKSGQLELL
jgi:predicted ArsR family transcriptional regulator